MRVKVKIEGWIELPDTDQEFQRQFGPNIGLFSTDIENYIDRLSVEACQILLENNDFFESVHATKALVTDDEWELDVEPETDE